MDGFAMRLKELRTKAGMTQPELATRSGLSKGGIADLEQGRREPSLATAAKLAGALGVTIDALHKPAAKSMKPAKRGRPRKGK
jgi:transcriptional regulator with XRE-family HTH domain